MEIQDLAFGLGVFLVPMFAAFLFWFVRHWLTRMADKRPDK